MDVPLEDGAVSFFAAGSVVFTLGAGVDLGVVVRYGRREQDGPVKVTLAVVYAFHFSVD